MTDTTAHLTDFIDYSIPALWGSEEWEYASTGEARRMLAHWLAEECEATDVELESGTMRVDGEAAPAWWGSCCVAGELVHVMFCAEFGVADVSSSRMHPGRYS